MSKAKSMITRPEPRASVKLVRCAVYTHKSTEEGLEQEFNASTPSGKPGRRSCGARRAKAGR